MTPDIEPSLGPSLTTTLVVGEEQSARARTSLWTRNVSSLGHRLEVMPHSARGPCFALIALRREAV